MAQYFYDSQVRRFLIQFARIFSDWNVTKGNDPAGNPIIVRVPIQYGDPSRMASTQIANNSPSSMPSAPLITYYITGLEYEQARTQDPTYVDSLAIRRRTYNTETQSYENTQGQAFTIERLMPVPYKLSINVDIWTTNYNQKLELIEQLGVLFNPALEIQSTDNFIDWTSLSVVYQDGLTFSSRSIPQASGNPIDIMSWKFYMPIWLSASAKAKKLGIIYKVINSIYQGNSITDMSDDQMLLGTRQKVTPYGYKVLLLGNSLQILPEGTQFQPPNNASDLPVYPETELYWSAVLNAYGAIAPGISQIWLENPNMDTPIVGTIVPNPYDDRILIYTIDPTTLPQNTLSPVNSIVNPLSKGPGQGLPVPADGQRYLLVEAIGLEKNVQGSNAWGNVIANANDIIQYNTNASSWSVVFNSATNTTVQYVTNLTTMTQYMYNENVWIKSYEGFYQAGDFSIVI